jgi:hypothetical protein
MNRTSEQLCNCLDNECHSALPPGWKCRKETNSSVGGNATTVSGAVSASSHGKTTASDGVSTSPETGARTSNPLAQICSCTWHNGHREPGIDCPVHTGLNPEGLKSPINVSGTTLIEELVRYITAVSDRITFAKILQKIEAAIQHSEKQPVETTCSHTRPPMSICGRHLECPDCGAVVQPEEPPARRGVVVRKGCTCDPTQYGGQCMCPPSQITVEYVQPENGDGKQT